MPNRLLEPGDQADSIVSVNVRERMHDCPSPVPEWWQGTDLQVGLPEVVRALGEAGLQPYRLSWQDGAIPVVTVLVPGLETFFLSRAGVPVLPTGRRG